MSIKTTYVGCARYHEKRRDKRNFAPTLVISIDGYTYPTLDWSLGGVLLSHYCGQRAQGEEIEGKVRVVTVPGSHPFKAVIVRRGTRTRELALRFTELSDAAFALLEDALTGRLRPDWQSH